MNNLQDKLDHYKQIKVLMSYNQSLTQIEQAVILAHAMNTYFGLQCINRSAQKIQYPEQWHKSQYGVYKFQYLYKDKNILFRFVNNDDKTLSINFAVEDKDELLQTQLQYSFKQLQNLIKKYLKVLEKLNEKKQEKSGSNKLIYNNSPFYEQPRAPIDPPLGRPRNDNPFRLPNPGNQYIGPDNQIFRGGNGFGNSQQNIPGLRRPPGSRYDPTNPFGIDQDNPTRPHDFHGFNQFGFPRSGGNNNFNPFG